MLSRKGDVAVKIRPIPAVLSFIITLVVLFSGWWVYQWVQVKQPVSELLNDEQHVSFYTIDAMPSHLNVDLQVDADFTLSSDYLRLLQQIKKQSRQTNVTVTIEDNPNDVLQTTWNDLYFILAEGLNRGEYYDMLQQLQQYPLADDIQLEVAMDDEKLYVWLEQNNGQKTLFEALPLHHSGERTGVKAGA